MARSADIISFGDRAKQSLAAARDAGVEGPRLAHLECVSGHLDAVDEAVAAVAAKATDIEFPLRSIPKWVPSGD